MRTVLALLLGCVVLLALAVGTPDVGSWILTGYVDRHVPFWLLLLAMLLGTAGGTLTTALLLPRSDWAPAALPAILWLGAYLMSGARRDLPSQLVGELLAGLLGLTVPLLWARRRAMRAEPMVAV